MTVHGADVCLYMLYLLEKERGKGVFIATLSTSLFAMVRCFTPHLCSLLYILLLSALSPPSLFLLGVSGESFRGALRVFERKSS